MDLGLTSTAALVTAASKGIPIDGAALPIDGGRVRATV
jgi:hypothetical protein